MEGSYYLMFRAFRIVLPPLFLSNLVRILGKRVSRISLPLIRNIAFQLVSSRPNLNHSLLLLLLLSICIPILNLVRNVLKFHSGNVCLTSSKVWPKNYFPYQCISPIILNFSGNESTFDRSGNYTW